MNNDYNQVSDIYDIYVQSDYDINFYTERYKNFKGKAVELMAGTGRLSIPLLKVGVNLDCVDLSQGLLDKLSSKILLQNLHTNIFQSDIRNLNLPDKYDLVIIAFNSFSEIIDKNDQKNVLKSIYNILNNNGEFLITFHNPVIRRKYISDKLTFVNEFKYDGKTLIFSTCSKENSDSIVSIKQFYEIYGSSTFFPVKRKLFLVSYSSGFLSLKI